ncbi:MAG: aspartate carbamoyltransferase regulatory subunit [Spirochaetales bacterium]|nr:aspartate carbamoyltransferase regulatory subunit [Spirochaetales bacterium]
MKQLKVDAIKDGTVIDHIPAGKAIQVLKILKTQGNHPVSIGMNLPSTKFGAKDILKIENHELSAAEVDRIAIIAPTASITIIRHYEVAEKRKVSVPEKLENVAYCPNPNCITNAESIATRFKKYKENADGKVDYMCNYCEKIYRAEDFKIKLG